MTGASVRRWFFRDPKLQPGEHVVAEWLANRSTRALARGGKFVLTNRRILFEPHRLDRAFFARSWQASLTDVSNVGPQRRTGAPLNGGLAERVAITIDGREYSFVVKNPSQVAAQIEQSL